MLSFNIVLHFPRGYIANPYWPAVEKLINLQKQSGMNRARSSANRRKALEEHLKGLSMTLADYERLEAEAARPFYTDDDGNIIIPELHVHSFLVATCDTVRAASRPCPPDQVRSWITVTPWATGKRAADGVWERFAVVSGGGGNKLSNQRGLRRSEYIAKFDASGTLSINEEFVEPNVLEKAIRLGGELVGIGASRKMGWGRFTLERFDAASASASAAADAHAVVT